ncbi:MAG TPA: hypothetical protein VMW10_03340, partial [Alphaproteobacteria bacterium]|nr:hypothetical protein [Alphaproteobacteria bacterium]
MFKKLISYLIIMSLFAPDILRAMEEDPSENLHRKTNVRRIPRSLHSDTRGSEQEEEAGSRPSSFNSDEFGGSWRVLPEDRKRMLRNMASLRREGEERESLLRGGEDWDDDFYWLEKTKGNGGASTEDFEEHGWFGVFDRVKQSVYGLKGKKTSHTKNEEENGEKEEDNEREKERDSREQDGLFSGEGEAYEESEIWADSQLREDGERPHLRSAGRRNNLGINGDYTPGDDEEAGPSSSIVDRIRELLPAGVNLDDLPLSVRGLLISAVELEQGDENQKKTMRLLVHMYDHILQGKLTRKQMLVGGIGGLLIAMGVGSGFVMLYLVSIENATQDVMDFLDPLIAQFGDFLADYAYWVIVKDVACRNVETIAKLSAPSIAD